MKPSFWSFLRAARQARHYTLWDAVHGLFYGRYIYTYISIGVGQHPLARRFGPLISALSRLLGLSGRARPEHPPVEETVLGDGTVAAGYHGKVIPLQAARQLLQVKEEIRLENLEKIIPYRRARDIILQNPDHIAVLDCPCRSARPNPCLPLDVCLVVGEPFASYVVEHNPRQARRITPQEAEAILEAEDRRGHVHHAFFKDAMLGRFYAICNCCACCCGAIQAHTHGTPMLASSGYVAQVDETLCLACGDCQPACQFGALSLGLSSQVDVQQCMGCGVCLNACPVDAITLQRAPEKGEPLEILALMTAAGQD